jgi:hypothetical protein
MIGLVRIGEQSGVLMIVASGIEDVENFVFGPKNNPNLHLNTYDI